MLIILNILIAFCAIRYFINVFVVSSCHDNLLGCFLSNKTLILYPLNLFEESPFFSRSCECLLPNLIGHRISKTIKVLIAETPHPSTSTHLKYSLSVLEFVETSGVRFCISMIIPPLNILSTKHINPYTKPLPSKI